ncbi:MarR family transcriptional regulator [bacterium]|nr:MarR family transcriptional regulator [bacterium]MBP9809913.1 MarR family transcriptional regulator [bacterium]
MKAADTRPASEKVDPASRDKADRNSLVAAKVMETVPYIMYYIRSHVLRQAETPASLPQLRVMAFIKNCPGSGLSRLAESLGVANATASTMVDRLVKAGMVARTNDPTSRRNVILSLTVAGEEHLLGSRSVAIEELSRVLAQLPPDKLAGIEESLALLKAAFTEANAKI